MYQNEQTASLSLSLSLSLTHTHTHIHYFPSYCLSFVFVSSPPLSLSLSVSLLSYLLVFFVNRFFFLSPKQMKEIWTLESSEMSLSTQVTNNDGAKGGTGGHEFWKF